MADPVQATLNWTQRLAIRPNFKELLAILVSPISKKMKKRKLLQLVAILTALTLAIVISWYEKFVNLVKDQVSLNCSTP